MKAGKFIDKLTGRGLEDQVDEYSEIVGEVLFGIERRMTSMERKRDSLADLFESVKADAPGITARQQSAEDASERLAKLIWRLELRMKRLRAWTIIFFVLLFIAILGLAYLTVKYGIEL